MAPGGLGIAHHLLQLLVESIRPLWVGLEPDGSASAVWMSARSGEKVQRAAPALAGVGARAEARGRVGQHGEADDVGAVLLAPRFLPTRSHAPRL